MIEIPIWSVILAIYGLIAAFVGFVVYAFGSIFGDNFGLAKPLSIMAAIFWPLLVIGWLWNKIRGDK